MTTDESKKLITLEKQVNQLTKVIDILTKERVLNLKTLRTVKAKIHTLELKTQQLENSLARITK